MKTLTWKTIYSSHIVLLFILMFTSQSFGVEPWKITVLDNPGPGYLRFDSNVNFRFFLLDNYANAIYKDTVSRDEEYSFYKFMPNGLWSSLYSGKRYFFDQTLTLKDSISLPDEYGYQNFHDIIPLENGHYLFLCSKDTIMDLSGIVENGKTDAKVTYSIIVEADVGGNVYFSWKTIDHFAITDVTEDIELFQPNVDFDHANSLAVDSDGNILLSSRHLDEITKINKNTGDIMWRLGGSKCKNNEFTFTNDEINGFKGFSHQHSISILPNGDLLMFDNGNLRPKPFSRAVEYKLDQDAKTINKVWEYRHDPDYFAYAMGSVQRLPNGNTLIDWVNNEITEVRYDKSIAMKLEMLQEHDVYRAYKCITFMDAVTKNITQAGNYTFSDEKYQTNVTLSITDYKWSGPATIEKHRYAPVKTPSTDTNYSRVLPYRWVLSSKDVKQIDGSIHINCSSLDKVSNPNKTIIYKRDQEASGDFYPLNTSWNPSTQVISAAFSGRGEFILCSYVLDTPVLLAPMDNVAGIGVDETLKWKKLKGASSYKVQLSESGTFDSMIVDTIITNDTTLSFSGLDNGTVYYWRAAGINIKDTSQWSGSFNFTTKLSVPELVSPANQSTGIKPDSSLKWAGVKGAGFYRLQIAEDADFEKISSDLITITIPSHPLDFLDSYTKYYWRVLAYNSTDTSDWSEARMFTTKLAAPNLIEPARNKLDLPLSGDLKWESVKGAVSYSVRLADNNDFDPLIVDAEGLVHTTYHYGGLKKRTQYYWKIRAAAENDTSEWSDSRLFTTVYNISLQTPVLQLPADKSDSNNLNCVFKWKEVEYASSYSFQLSLNSDFSTSVSAYHGLSSNSITLPGLNYGTRYYWRVQAFSGTDSSKWSDPWMMNTMEKPVLPVVNLSYPANGKTGVSINGQVEWQPAANAEYYMLEISGSPDFKDNILREEALDTSFCEYKSLAFSTLYYWHARYIADGDTSAWSDTWAFTTMPSDSIASPALTSPANGVKKIPVYGTFTWAAVSNAESYKVELSENPQFNPTVMSRKGITENKLDYNLDYNTGYYWRVAAVNGSKTGPWSVTRSFVTVLAPPQLLSPQNNAVEIPAAGELRWAAVPGADRYRIQLSDNADFNDPGVDMDEYRELSLSYNLDENSTYFWRVMAESVDNEGEWSTFSFTTIKPSGVNDTEITGNEKIYPNPAGESAILEFNLTNNSNVTLSVINTIGITQLYYDAGLMGPGKHVINMDLRRLPAGMYFVSIYTDNGSNILKLIIDK